MDRSSQEFKDIINQFKNLTIAVLGDIVADIYVYGKPVRLSREAPVLVVRHDGERILPGSAGNTIHNLCQLGARVFPVGVLGDDEAGRSLLAQFSTMNVDMGGLISLKERTTITKTRIMAGDDHTSKQQVIRIDREVREPLPESAQARIAAYIDAIGDKVQAFILSDYGYDVLTPDLLDQLKTLATHRTVVVDSRYRLRLFSGVTAITPNESEAEAASQISITDTQDAVTVGRKLRDELNLGAVLITRGNRGMVLVDDSGKGSDIPICGSDEITDVTGAGDTVAAVFTASLAAGASFYQAARLSNYAGAVVVMKRGSATASPEEILRVIEDDFKRRS